MAKIRHEINLLCQNLAGSGTVTINADSKINFNPLDYSGNLSYYLEISIQQWSGLYGTVQLYCQTNSTAYLDIPAPTNQEGLIRSTIRTSPLPSGTYYLRVFSNNQSISFTIYSAKLIIIQDTGTDPVTTSETQIELGGYQSTVSATAVPLTNIKYWTYNAADWDGEITAYFEATISNASTRATTAILQYSTDWTNWYSVPDALVTVSSTTVTLVRSTAFTLIDGRHYRVAFYTGSTMYSAYLYNAKIIIKQQAYLSYGYVSTLVTGNATAPSVTAPISQSFQVAKTDTLEKVVLGAVQRFGTATGSVYAKIYNAIGTYGTDNVPTGNALATSDALDIATFDSTLKKGTITFTGVNKITLNAGTTYCLVFETDAVTDASNYFFIRKTSASYTPQGNYAFYNNGSWVPVSADDISLGIQVSTMSNVTKLEEQYLLLNTGDSGVGTQKKLAKWDSSDWSGVTNTYYYAHDSNAATNSSRVVDATPAVDVDLAIVTGTNQVISSAFSMPVSGDVLDVNVTNTSAGIIGAGRVLAKVNVVAAAPVIVAPTVSTVAATAIHATSAGLNANLTTMGSVNGVNNSSVTVGFEYGLTTSYGTTVTIGTKTVIGPFNTVVSGLTMGSTYHYRAFASTANGTVYGEDMSFVAAAVAPVISTGTAQNVTDTSADLHITVTSLGDETGIFVSVDYGLTLSYEEGTKLRTGEVTSPGDYYVTVDTLSPETTYHFRAHASGSSNWYGADATFTTLATPVVTSIPVQFNIGDTIIKSAKGRANIGDTIVRLTKAQANIDGVIKTIWIAEDEGAPAMLTWSKYQADLAVVEDPTIYQDTYSDVMGVYFYPESATVINGNISAGIPSWDYITYLTADTYFLLETDPGAGNTEIAMLKLCISCAESREVIVQWKQLTVGATPGTFITTVEALPGTYPDDGVGEDGYYYRR